MASCKAGGCEIECGGGKGCGCIAESDNPDTCNCFCFGGTPGKGLTLEQSTPVDVSISDLPLFEVARFLNGVHTESIVVPIDRMNEQVSINLERKPFGDVLNQLGFTTSESIERGRRKTGLLMFLAGFAIGALILILSR